MICRSCGSAVDDYAKTCPSCDYAYTGTQTSVPAVLGSIDKSLRAIKTILVWGVILSAAVAIVWLFARFVNSL